MGRTVLFNNFLKHCFSRIHIMPNALKATQQKFGKLNAILKIIAPAFLSTVFVFLKYNVRTRRISHLTSDPMTDHNMQCMQSRTRKSTNQRLKQNHANGVKRQAKRSLKWLWRENERLTNKLLLNSKYNYLPLL